MVNVFVKGDLYQKELKKVVNIFERHYGIQLLFGSFQIAGQPTYTYGGDGAHFHRLSQEQAETIKSALIAQDVPESDIEIR